MPHFGSFKDREWAIFFSSGTIEYFIPMANIGPRGDSHHQLEGMFKKVRPVLS
jgi:hypothetical protein